MTPIIERGRISYLFIFTRDFERMLAFYRDVLGFTVAYFEDGNCAFLELTDSHGPQIALYPGRESASADPGHWFVVIDVPDLDAAALRVKDVMLQTDGIFAVPHGRALQITDPDGNVIQLHQRA